MIGGLGSVLETATRESSIARRIYRIMSHFSDSIVGGPFPYQSHLGATGFQFGVSTSRNFDGVSIHQPTQTDWSVGFVEHNGDILNRKALSWVRFSVNLYL